MGCVKIMPNMIQTLKDTGFQRMNLNKNRNDNYGDTVKGQIVISLLLLNNNIRVANGNNNYESIDLNMDSNMENVNENQNTSLNFINENNGLPAGWEERKTSCGRVYYVNHNDKHTQWQKPTIAQINNSTNNNSNSTGRQAQQQNENAEPELNNRSSQRRSTRHRNYLARNTLHQAVANLTENENIINTNNNNNVNQQQLQQPIQPNHNRNNITSLSIDSTSSATNINSSLTNINNNNTHNNSTSIIHQRSISNLSNSNLNQSSTHANSTLVTSVDNLPEGYEMRIAPKGQVYFYHVSSNTSTWYDPRVPKGKK